MSLSAHVSVSVTVTVLDSAKYFAARFWDIDICSLNCKIVFIFKIDCMSVSCITHPQPAWHYSLHGFGIVKSPVSFARLKSTPDSLVAAHLAQQAPILL